jgi:hypothetical protein
MALLRMEWQGCTMTAMAQKLRISKASIYSRFQRMGSRMGVHRRQDVARLAAERGLLHLSNAVQATYSTHATPEESAQGSIPVPMPLQPAAKSGAPT